MALLLAVVTSCGDSDPAPAAPTSLSGSCGLPTPDPNRDETVVPELFLPEGAEIAKAQKERGGFITAINVPLSVQGALKTYRDAIEASRYEIIQEDNEGFEAELFLRRGKRLAAVQIRVSTCDDASIVFVNEIDPEIANRVATPAPSG